MLKPNDGDKLERDKLKLKQLYSEKRIYNMGIISFDMCWKEYVIGKNLRILGSSLIFCHMLFLA